ncbi:exported hypothetical protein [Candidatus Sulfobium mesophilum]|uniref:Uncharacterized protein n=1 Tax=Candidatus Sulfobium mesophilum TaxID=2016548 RepID=A0A2U3QEW8_9BACT|nr:exported hypothetical protein [Candidatus Sulfobium mesophilum]
MKRRLTDVALFLLVTAFLVGMAEGAGSLTVTFKDKNGSALAYAYVYLRSAANEPPMEKYFSPADQILGPSGANGTITATNIPEGDYYVRITRRNPLAARPLGPPEVGDYTWVQAKPITINTNTMTNLGTKVAWAFGSAPMSISGTVKSYSGTPLASRYVRLQIGPCVEGSYPTYESSDPDPSLWVDPNYCNGRSWGKKLAFQRTDASGNYTIFLREPGTYYVYESTCLGDQHQDYIGNPCIGYGAGPITINAGEQKIVNITGY